jgi:hypothetical protein
VSTAYDDLPGSLGDAVRWELRAALRRPFTIPLVVTFNALLMAGAWLLLPVTWQDWLFTLHGPSAFAMVLAFWMYADVPATNVLAPDRERVLAALDDPAMLRRLLFAKNIALWFFVAPFCAVVAVVIGFVIQDWPPVLVSITAIGVVPFGVLGVAGWVGIVWPYHPRDLRFRWEHRRQWFHMLVRWCALLLVPYGVVPGLGAVVIAPSLVLWSLLSGAGLSERLPTSHFLGGVLLAAVVSMGAFVGGYAVAIRLVRRRREVLRSYLADPDRG